MRTRSSSGFGHFQGGMAVETAERYLKLLESVELQGPALLGLRHHRVCALGCENLRDMTPYSGTLT